MNKIVAKNFVYNIIYQIVNMILPVVTAPYLSRVLGETEIGRYSYVYSVVYYFMLFSNMGLVNYGNRSIASVRDDSKKVSRLFSEIYCMQLVSNIVFVIIYICYFNLFENEMTLFWLLLPFLISCSFDITWFFYGIEQFGLVTTRTLLVRIINVLGILLLVKSEQDIGKYSLIMSLSTLLSQLIIFVSFRKYTYFVKIDPRNIIKHFKPNLILFIPVIAISLYKVMDKIMLGKMSVYSEVGYYDYSERIVNLMMGVITALGTVMMPQISFLVQKKETLKIKKYIAYSMAAIMFLAFGMGFGMLSIVEDLVPLLYGSSFKECILIIAVLIISIPFIAWANVIRTQYLIPYSMDKIYIISVALGALVNLILNSQLIPKYNATGAAIATVFAEATVCIYQTFKVRKMLDISLYVKEAAIYFGCGIIMYLICNAFKSIQLNIMIKLSIQIVIGLAFYLLICWPTSKIVRKCIEDMYHE